MTNWQAHELGQVVKIDRSSLKPNQIKPGTTYLGLEHIQSGGKIIGSQTVQSGELKSSKFEFTPEHLLYGKLRPYLAKIAAPDFPGICSTDIIPLLPGPNVERKYLLHFLRQKRMVEFANSRASGANLPRLSPKQLAKFKLPLPPLPEQKRIAKSLDAADALRARRRESLDQLDALLQSTFLEMFGDPVTNPKGWEETAFGDIFDIGSSKRVLQKQWKDSGVPFYRAREIVKLAEEGFVENDLFISEEHFEKLKCKHDVPKPGDLMVSAVGTLGACYVVKPGDRFYFKDASVLRFRPNKNINPVFAQFAFGTEYVRRQVRSGSGSTVGTYTISRAKNTLIPLPPVCLQQRFATIVESVERQKSHLRAHLAELDALFASLQARAFAGEL